ncbi:MAG: serine/threonine protein phosphatase [Alphaproteobacteria bacterium]|nr:serine/threonine protein phosphatase [Alphaproteobacteria bacterium]
MPQHKGVADLFRGRRHIGPAVPDGVRVYAIGDVHGRADLLDRLLERIWADAGEGPLCNLIVLLGDYVDRGQQSRQVLERLVAFDRPGWRMVALRGNHDQMVLNFLADPPIYRAWREFGAPQTLVSYGVAPPADDKNSLERARDALAAAMPEAHVDFLRTLPYSHVVGGYMFVHAGVRPGVALDRQVPADLMWIRDEFLLSDCAFGKIVVHGHTPSERPVVMPNRIGVDTGAYATGCLTAVVLEGGEHSFLSVG